jgi:glycosyltransferase involved in cell wall biosynthesis
LRKSRRCAAQYAYVGGDNLDDKIGPHEFTHALIRKKQEPVSMFRSANAIRHYVKKHNVEIIHAHLTYDHVLGLAAARNGVQLVRTFHARRPLRTDPLTRTLLSQTAGIAVVNGELARHKLLHHRKSVITPPPLDDRFFTPDGANVRSALGFTDHDLVLGYIGKVSPGRGFEEAILTLSHVRRIHQNAKLMIIGRGPYRPYLENMIAELGLTPYVVWAGYHEDDLPEHYRAADVMLFTAPGSDEGHRAVLEELGCGRPVAAYPIAGVEAILAPDAASWIAEEGTPAALAAVVHRLQGSDRAGLRESAVRRAGNFNYAAAGARLAELYGSLSAARGKL